MKSATRLLKMLVHELKLCRESVVSVITPPIYYNEVLGDTSFLLAAFLQSVAEKNVPDWDDSIWFDDCLITHVKYENDAAYLNGILIFGKNDTTSQWTNPFAIKITFSISSGHSHEFVASYADTNNMAVSYGQFKDNRSYWSRPVQSWRYVFDSTNSLVE